MNITEKHKMINEKKIDGWAGTQVQYGEGKSGYYAAFIFLVWPLLAVASAIWNYKSSWGKNILWAFVAFYGFTFAIGLENQNSDIVRYVAEVEYLHGLQMTPASAFEYYRQSGEIDILRSILAVTVSRFTDSQSVLTLIYGIIFGFFFSRNVWFVLSRIEGKMRLFSVLLVVCLVLTIPFWNITTFRMWTAAHIFIYGLLPFLYEKKWDGLAIAACSILVHFSFILPLGVVFVYALCGNRVMIYFIFFVASFFVAEINLEAFNNIVESYAPEIIQERTTGYRSEAYVESHRESGDEDMVWYAKWDERALRWSLAAFLVFLFVKGMNVLKKKEHWLRLFSFVLLFYGVSNVLDSLPSGGRYMAIANFLALTLIILYIQNQAFNKSMKRLALATLPLLLLFVIVAIRTGLYSMSFTSLLGNPVVAILLNENHISLNDILKTFL